jgi:hypothetical protein
MRRLGLFFITLFIISGITLIGINRYKNKSADENPEIFKFCISDGRCGLADEDGNIVLEPKYVINGFMNGFAPIYSLKENKIGFIDASGKIVIRPKFEDVGDFSSDGFAPAFNGKWGIINKKGDFMTQENFFEINPFFSKNGLIGAAKAEDSWGFIDKSGNWIIPAQFDFVFDFKDNGLAAVKKEGKYGFVNEKGEIVIEPVFEGFFHYKNGLTVVWADGKYQLIDKNGSLMSAQFTEISGYRFNDNFTFANSDEGVWGIVGTDGKFTPKPDIQNVTISYRYAMDAIADLKNGKKAFVNEEGGIVEINFDSMGIFANGLASVRLEEELIGYIDANMQVVLKPVFEDTRGFSNALAAVKKEGSWGFIDKKGEFVIEPQFDDTTSFNENGLAAVKADEGWGIINEKGKWVLKPKYFEILSIEEGRFFINSRERYGYTDKKGKILFWIDYGSNSVIKNAKGKIVWQDSDL